MQKSAIRIITGSSYNSHTEPLFKRLQILPLPDLISFSKLQFMRRFSQNSYLPRLIKLGLKIQLEISEKTKFNYVTLINCNMPTLT